MWSEFKKNVFPQKYFKFMHIIVESEVHAGEDRNANTVDAVGVEQERDEAQSVYGVEGGEEARDSSILSALVQLLFGFLVFFLRLVLCGWLRFEDPKYIPTHYGVRAAKLALAVYVQTDFQTFLCRNRVCVSNFCVQMRIQKGLVFKKLKVQ